MCGITNESIDEEFIQLGVCLRAGLSSRKCVLVISGEVEIPASSTSSSQEKAPSKLLQFSTRCPTYYNKSIHSLGGNTPLESCEDTPGQIYNIRTTTMFQPRPETTKSAPEIRHIFQFFDVFSFPVTKVGNSTR